MTPDERLAGPLIKAARAKFHIDNVDEALRNFLDTNPYSVAKKFDAQTGKTTSYVDRVTPIPIEIGPIIGDALFNLRSALDHLAQQFYLMGTGTTQVSDRASFPIFDSLTYYNAGFAGKVAGMRQEAQDFISATKPYKGGNEDLWRLHKLNNIDKHRLLVTAAGSFRSVNVGPAMSSVLREKIKGMFPEMEVPLIEFHLRPADRLCPLKEGDELFIDGLGLHTEEDKNMQFAFDVSFYEPQIMEAEPVFAVLYKLYNVVDRILNDAKSLLS